MKTKLFCMLFLCCCMMACEQKNEPESGSGGTIPSSNPKISGTATVLSTSGRTSCDYVQLWENGPKWATFNVGATITDYANLTEGADSISGNVAYYNTANVGGLYAWMFPYHNARNGCYITRTEDVGTGLKDVATTLWGSNWKTPTAEQLDTLCDIWEEYGVTWTWCDGSERQYVKGCTLKGYKVSGVGDYAEYSIFLPAAGCSDYNDDIVYDAGEYGYYWSSTEGNPDDAYFMNLSMYGHGYGLADWFIRSGIDNRQFRKSVRAILAE